MWMRPGVIAAAIAGYIAPTFFDTFEAPDERPSSATGTGSLLGRIINSKTWAVLTGTGTNTGCLGIDGSGNLSGLLTATGGAQNKVIGVITIPQPASNIWRVIRRGNPNPAVSSVPWSFVHDQVNYVGTDLWDKIMVQLVSTEDSSSNVLSVKATHNAGQTTTSSTPSQMNTFGNRFGDVVESYYEQVSGAWKLSVRVNGYLRVDKLDLTSLGFAAMTGAFGFGGQMTASQFESIQIDDPATQGCITLVKVVRNWQLDSSGNALVVLEGTYTQGQPPAVYYTLYNRTTKAALTNHNDIPVPGLIINSGAKTWRSGLITIAAADIVTAGVYPIVRRKDVFRSGVAAISEYPGSVSKFGDIFILDGQSNQEFAYTKTTGATMTAVANAFYLDANSSAGMSTSTDGNPLDAKVNLIPAAPHVLNGYSHGYSDALGSVRPTTWIRAGRGGNNALQRGVGTDIHTERIAGIIRAGRRVAMAIVVDGEYESTDATRNAYQAAHDAVWDDVEDTCGMTRGTLKVMLSPVGSCWDLSTDALYEQTRYLQWMMCFYNSTLNSLNGNTLSPLRPNRYYWGPPTVQMQHGSNDQYHGTGTSYEPLNRNRAYHADYILRGTATNRLDGPAPVSVTKTSDTTAVLRFILNGASSMALRNRTNSGTISFTNHRGGTRWGAGTIGNKVIPTNSAFQAGAPAGYEDWIFTFAAGTFTGLDVKVSGPYGREPFNQGKEVSTALSDQMRATLATEQSMFVGIYPTGDIPIQAYYQGDGNYLNNVLTGS